MRFSYGKYCLECYTLGGGNICSFFFLCVCVHAAGWEVIYDFLNHILGVAGKFNGVAMHLGHFRAHIDQKIKQSNPHVRGFFDPSAWREFIQSGTAARLQGLPSYLREPCCSLRYIGGDGTAIGVAMGNATSIQPVWQPPTGLRDPVKKWGRMQRCAIGDDLKGIDASSKNNARDFIRNATSGSVTESHIREIRDDIDSISFAMPDSIKVLLELWFTFDRRDERWDPIRRLLRACSCQDSICGIVTLDMVPFIQSLTSIAAKQNSFADSRDLHAWKSALQNISTTGMGPEIKDALEACRKQYLIKPMTGKYALVAVSTFLTYLGEKKYIP